MPGGRGAPVAKKRFGQHFLADEGVIGDIVRAIQPRPGDALVEIGPGLGAMTQPLLERAGALTVIELDRDLAARLRRTGAARAGLEVIEADVLKVDFAALAATAGRALRVVGNLPYNISSPILFHLLPVAHLVQDQHFMLQKEVVDRMAAAWSDIVGVADIFAGNVSQRDGFRGLDDRETDGDGSNIDDCGSVGGPKAAMLPVVARL